jgi:hypothetical protein
VKPYTRSVIQPVTVVVTARVADISVRQLVMAARHAAEIAGGIEGEQSVHMSNDGVVTVTQTVAAREYT